MIAVLAGIALTDTSVANSFAAWRALHGKSYSTPAAESRAFEAFAANDATIRAHNALGLSYMLGHNAYSDITSDEFIRSRTTLLGEDGERHEKRLKSLQTVR